MRQPKKKESAAIAVAAGSRVASSAYNEEDNPTKARRKCRRPRLDPVETLRQMNLECEQAKCEYLAKAASLRLIKRKIQALLREVDK